MALFKDFIFFIFSLSLFINAILFVPQIIKIVKEKKSNEFSKIMFVGFCLIQLSSILYGIINHDWILTIGYSFALLACGTVTVLIFLYSGNSPNEKK